MYIYKLFFVISRVLVLSYCYPTAILLLSYGMTNLRIAEYYETVSMSPVVILLHHKSSIKSKMC